MPSLPRPRGHLAVMACITVFSLTQGVSYPLLALALRARGHDEAAIGLSAAMTALGVLLSGFVMAPLVRRLGARWTVLGASGLGALLYLCYPLLDDYVAWTVLRLAVGVCAGAAFVVGELWLNQVVRPESRGRSISAYGAVLSAGFAAGPFLLALTGTEGWPPFLLGAGGCLLTLLLVLWLAGDLPDRPPPAPAGALGVWRAIWLLLTVVGVVAFFDQAVLSLVPVFGAGRGLREEDAALLVAVMVVGNIVLQVPLGLLADRLGPRVVMAAACLIAAGISLLLPSTIAQSWLAWPLLFVWGALGFGIYILSLVELGRRFTDDRLLAASAAYAVVWGVGGLAGPAVSGTAMELAGDEALFWLSALLLTALGLLLLGDLRRASREAPANADAEGRCPTT
ncbi:MAG TPA: MFS transporter [Kiloniellales bacterium]|nr:MFS transporter [Kiloniellales bacterium]